MKKISYLLQRPKAEVTGVSWKPRVTYETYDNLDVRFHGFECDCASCDETAATDGYDGGVDVRNLFKNLKTHRTLTSQDVGVVETTAARASKFSTYYVYVSHLFVR